MSEETPTLTITLYDNEFTVSAPYAEGHTVTAAEARALNQVRKENIANNNRKAVKEAMEIEDEKERAEALKTIAAEVAKYDAEYEFTLASSGGKRSTMSSLEKMARKLARNALAAKLKASGSTLKAYKEEKGDDNYTAKIIEISEMEAIQAMAKEMVDEEQARAKKLAAISA